MRKIWISGSERGKTHYQFFIVKYMGVLKDAGIKRMGKKLAALRKRQDEEQEL